MSTKPFRYYSELSTFMACSMAHHYRFEVGLEPPIDPESPMGRGALIDDQLVRLARNEKVDGDPFINKVALRTWSDWQAAAPSCEFVQVAPELKGMVHGQTILIHPDGLVRDGGGGLWVLDWKSHVKMPPQDPAPSPQFPIYADVYRQNGYEIAGVLVPRMLQRLAALPKINKTNKRVQKPKACGMTDRATYLQAIEMAGHSPTAYRSELEEVDNMRFFRLDKTPFLPGYVDAVVAELAVPTRLMKDPNKRPYRHLRVGFVGCERCHYKDLCHAELVTGPNEGLREALKEQWERGEVVEPQDVQQDITE